MKPIKFKESNKKLLKPNNMSDEECESLTVFTDGKRCISCWKMNWKERILALLLGKAWISVHSGYTQPPIKINILKSIFFKKERR